MITSAEFKAPKIFIILTHLEYTYTNKQNAIHRPTILLLCDDAQSELFFFRLEEVFQQKLPTSPRGGFDAVDGQSRRRRWCRHHFRGDIYPARAGDEARQRGFLVSLYACVCA